MLALGESFVASLADMGTNTALASLSGCALEVEEALIRLSGGLRPPATGDDPFGIECVTFVAQHRVLEA
jgi:hypothetical protein